LEVVRTTLGGDIPECVAADFFAHRDGDVSDFTGFGMDVPEFEVTASSGNWLVSHFGECIHEFPR
jgi:hypothetical protein